MKLSQKTDLAQYPQTAPNESTAQSDDMSFPTATGTDFQHGNVYGLSENNAKLSRSL